MRKIVGLGLTAVAAAISIVALPHAFQWHRVAHGNDSGFIHAIIDPEGPRDPWGKSVGDIDGDGLPDLIVGGHDSQQLVWYRNPDWKKSTIATGAPFATDHEVADIDGDGHNDVVSITDTQLLWYRNPDWTPTVIDTVELHDIELADFDSDGDIDVVGRDQGAFGGSGGILSFYRQDAPDAWTRFTLDGPDGEGLRVFDVDADGRPDVVVNGQWFANPGQLGEREWRAHTYTNTWRWPHAYVDVGDIDGDARADIVLVPAEPSGERYRIAWFKAPEDVESLWHEHVIDADVEAVHHFVGIGDMDSDGASDIVSAQMHQGQDPDAIKIYFNRDGAGTQWAQRVLAATGSHSMRLTDIDGDGDPDLFGANWSGEHQPVELWRNQSCDTAWRRHGVDLEMPWRSIFVGAADLDGDGLRDIVAGGWWYRNPGRADGQWTRNVIGGAAHNLAAIYDMDGDGNLDILATEGKDADANANFVWARNDGKGRFEVIPAGRAQGDFLQGVATGRFAPGGRIGAALSWHQQERGVQMLAVPEDPANESWPWQVIADSSQDEALSAGDIDGDGDSDLLLGTRWLRNDGGEWRPFTLFETQAKPDRNRLADINRDGRLDALIGYEAISSEGVVAWYEHAQDPTGPWREHVIARVIGPMSLDVADMDRDGDLDVVVGEHNLEDPAAARLLILENRDGFGREWRQQVVHTGDEHHDGAQVVDIDNDGDNDIVSIGWSHQQVLLYENRAANCRVEPPSVSAREATR
ncbi:MAG: FG-GAP repeat domain-containing protein [Gammaproteobacteria bacterium]